MSTLRICIVCGLAGFFAMYAAGGLREDPTTLVGWALLAVGCYLFGLGVLLVAAVVLTLAGCEVRWPGQSSSTEGH
jgi:uncharacterized membrane protein YedE/YeeE